MSLTPRRLSSLRAAVMVGVLAVLATSCTSQHLERVTGATSEPNSATGRMVCAAVVRAEHMYFLANRSGHTEISDVVTSPYRALDYLDGISRSSADE